MAAPARDSISGEFGSMFELYTVNSKRVLFYSRYEACHLGSPRIETEHLLLGLLREDEQLFSRYLDAQSIANLHREVEEHAVHQRIDAAADMPLTPECQRALSYGAEEARCQGHRYIGTEHLLIGLMRDAGTVAARLLAERGLQLAALRESLRLNPPENNIR
jgi:ATP-dependent Clp protease ATP-binding subunit ClpC